MQLNKKPLLSFDLEGVLLIRFRWLLLVTGLSDDSAVIDSSQGQCPVHSATKLRMSCDRLLGWR
nr:hypothetical protein DOP62_10810 [Synechococcus elongatus PCC 11801]